MLMKNLIPSLLVAGAIIGAATLPSVAQDDWTYPVYDIQPPRADPTVHGKLPELSTYTALKPADVKEKSQLCVLLPQAQDAVFVAYIYGAIDEAKRLGQAVTIFDAGGYANHANQRAQFENCVTLGVKGIIVQAINSSGWEADVANAKGAGIKVVNLIEPVATAVDGRSLVDFRVNGGLLGAIAAKEHPAGGAPAKLLIIPGAAGLPFVEDTVAGAKEAVAGSAVNVADVLYGDMTDTAQLKLVEDALVAHPDVQYIIGNAMAVKQAANTLAQRGMSDKVKLMATYLDPDVMAGIKSGTILAGTAESSVMLSRIAVSLTVAAINGDTAVHDIVPSVGVVTKDNVDDAGIAAANFQPEGWQPVFKLD